MIFYTSVHSGKKERKVMEDEITMNKRKQLIYEELVIFMYTDKSIRGNFYLLWSYLKF